MPVINGVNADAQCAPLHFFTLRCATLWHGHWGGIYIFTIDEGNIRKAVLQLSLPAVAEQTLFMIVGVVSTVFVGRISKEAISAVGLVNILAGFVMVMFVALSTGSTVLVARLMGENDTGTAKQALKQSVVIGAAASLLLSVLLFFCAAPLIGLLFGRAEADVVNMAVLYFKITMVTFPLALVNILISGCLRGAGDTVTPMLIANIVNVLNVILGIILIFGIKLPFLHINGGGIAGAGWAVAISRAVGGILSFAMLYRRGNPIKTDLFKNFRFDPELMKRVLKVGIPAAMEQIVMQGGFLVLQVIISGMGTIAIAVYQICMSVNSISYIPIWGFGMGATTLVGQSLGAKKPHIAEKCGWSALKIGVAVIVLLTAVIFIFPDKLISIYNSDPDVIGTGAAAIRIFSLSQPFLAVVVVISGALRGAGDITYVMITSFIGIWIFRIMVTIGLNLAFHLGINGVWIALCADFFIRSIMYFVRFKRGRWKEIAV